MPPESLAPERIPGAGRPHCRGEPIDAKSVPPSWFRTGPSASAVASPAARPARCWRGVSGFGRRASGFAYGVLDQIGARAASVKHSFATARRRSGVSGQLCGVVDAVGAGEQVRGAVAVLDQEYAGDPREAFQRLGSKAKNASTPRFGHVGPRLRVIRGGKQ